MRLPLLAPRLGSSGSNWPLESNNSSAGSFLSQSPGRLDFLDEIRRPLTAPGVNESDFRLVGR